MRSKERTITIIVAYDEDKIIANGQNIPWDIPEDKKHFKQTVGDSPVLMGRKTYEAMGGEPMNSSLHIIMSKDYDSNKENVVVANDLYQAAFYISSLDENEVFICGGSYIYDLFLDYADRMIVSKISGEHEGDTYFPDFNKELWDKELIKNYENFDVFEYKRKSTI